MPFAVAHAYEEHDAVMIISAAVAVIVIKIIGISFDIPVVEIFYRDYRDIHIPLCAYALELREKPLFIIIAEDIRIVDEQRIGSFVSDRPRIGRRRHGKAGRAETNTSTQAKTIAVILFFISRSPPYKIPSKWTSHAMP